MEKLGLLVVGVVVCGLVVAGGLVDARSGAASSATVGSDSTHVDVSIGGFVFEQGARLAVEIVRDDSCACLCDRIDVTGFALIDAGGEELVRETYGEPVEITEWLGRVALVDGAGTPLPSGAYTFRVETSIGAFSANIEIVSTSSMSGLGRFASSATVCGLDLRVYRLVSEEDQGAMLTVRRGDRLMVALEGNATTGYAWANTLVYEYAVLRETEESEYRETPHAPNLVGSGGEFLFRYKAIDIGPQAFRFAYQRPWESVEPAEIVEFDATVQ